MEKASVSDLRTKLLELEKLTDAQRDLPETTEADDATPPPPSDQSQPPAARARAVFALSVQQQTALDDLNEANEQLRDELASEKKAAKTHEAVSAQAQILKLQAAGDTYTRKIELERRRIAEMDKQMSSMQRKIWEQRQKMGGINASRENNAAITKQIGILENRLDKALKKYNESVANNKRQRESIDNLRREKLVAEEVHGKLERELAEKKREMARIIEASTRAYEARDAAQAEMLSLKEQAEKELAAFEEEWKQLGSAIEMETSMKDFMSKERGKRAGKAQGDGKAAAEDQKQSKLKKKMAMSNWGIAKDKVSIAASMEKVQSYEEVFSQIQEATGITDIDELVDTFVEAEDQNYNLFNYVNEINAECDKLEEQIGEVKGEIEKYKGQGHSTENQRKKILKDLEERLAKTESKADQYERKHEMAMRTINALKTGILGIFKKIGCSTPANLELLGDEGVSETNMMQYLGIIEQRTNEILQLYASASNERGAEAAPAVAQGSAAAASGSLSQGPRVPVGSVKIFIEPPTSTEGGDVAVSSDESEAGGAAGGDELGGTARRFDRPLTRDELKSKTIKSIAARDKKKLQIAALEQKMNMKDSPSPGHRGGTVGGNFVDRRK